MKAKTIMIMGLTQVSASVALALRAADASMTLVGFDPSREIADQAKTLGVVDRLARDVRQAVAESDMIVLDLPARALETALKIAGQALPEGGLIIDFSSLKLLGRRMAEHYLERGHYVSVGPVLAADYLSATEVGLSGARADLFKDSVICILADSRADPAGVESTVNLGRLLGTTPFFLDPEEYDALLTGVATLPGLVAAALTQAVTSADGWRDMLRFAGAPFALATAAMDEADLAALALQDQTATLRWLDAVQTELDRVRTWVEQGDNERLSLLVNEMRQKRDQWLKERAGHVWLDDLEPEIKPLTIKEMLLGGLLGRSDERSDS